MKLLDRILIDGKVGEVVYIEERPEGVFVGIEFEGGETAYYPAQTPREVVK